jgi:uncharacterized protein YxeA
VPFTTLILILILILLIVILILTLYCSSIQSNTPQTNRFEQLCINYANEKLQQRFTEDVFKTVQAEYQAEGIKWELITYEDNAEVLELLEGRLGILDLLNEEVHNITLHIISQHSILYHSIAQYSIAQHNTTLHIISQHSTAQHIIA